MAHRNRILAAVYTCGLALSALEASQVRSIDLDRMTQRAARIFAGRCIRAEVVFDPLAGADVTVATFRVDRAVKGTTGRTVTVRMSDAHSTVPMFAPGEDVVLFLYGESALGLTAPVGLGQGRFEVVTDKQGRRRAVNDVGNENLRGTRRGRGRAESLDPEALLDRVERIVAGQ